jgi:hypothetical protein
MLCAHDYLFFFHYPYAMTLCIMPSAEAKTLFNIEKKLFVLNVDNGQGHFFSFIQSEMKIAVNVWIPQCPCFFACSDS